MWILNLFSSEKKEPSSIWELIISLIEQRWLLMDPMYYQSSNEHAKMYIRNTNYSISFWYWYNYLAQRWEINETTFQILRKKWDEHLISEIISITDDDRNKIINLILIQMKDQYDLRIKMIEEAKKNRMAQIFQEDYDLYLKDREWSSEFEPLFKRLQDLEFARKNVEDIISDLQDNYLGKS